VSPSLVILAAGRARRFGGCKPLAPVGPHGEAVIDLVASDALAGGFSTIVLVLGPATGPAIRYHVERTWPSSVDVRFALQEVPMGTVNAVLSASDHVGDQPYGVGNADDVYGQAACAQLATHLAGSSPTNADGTLLGVDERRSVTATGDGGFVSADGLEPAQLAPDSRVSMNLWGFTPEFHKELQLAMDAAEGASEEAEVLLPEVVAQSLQTSPFMVLPTDASCIGVTHPDDLGLVQSDLNRQVGRGERPAKLWAAAG